MPEPLKVSEHLDDVNPGQPGLESSRESSEYTTEIRDKVMRALQQNTNEAFPSELLLDLLPQKIRGLALNPENLEVRQISKLGKSFEILIIERDYPGLLTDVNDYEAWKKKCKQGVGTGLRVTPKPPSTVNKFHHKLSSMVEEGTLSLSDRVLLQCMLEICPHNPQVLRVGNFDGETHSGIGTDFYKNTLPDFCKKIGVRFIIGWNNARNIGFFRNTLGRSLREEIKPEYDQFLFGASPYNANEDTIQFLYPEDAIKFKIG